MINEGLKIMTNLRTSYEDWKLTASLSQIVMLIFYDVLMLFSCFGHYTKRIPFHVICVTWPWPQNLSQFELCFITRYNIFYLTFWFSLKSLLKLSKQFKSTKIDYYEAKIIECS